MEKTSSHAKSWSHQALVRALRSGSSIEKVARLKKIGILTPNGDLAIKYVNWGPKVSRAEDSPPSRKRAGATRTKRK